MLRPYNEVCVVREDCLASIPISPWSFPASRSRRSSRCTSARASRNTDHFFGLRMRANCAPILPLKVRLQPPCEGGRQRKRCVPRESRPCRYALSFPQCRHRLTSVIDWSKFLRESGPFRRPRRVRTKSSSSSEDILPRSSHIKKISVCP